jgi:hypothetical protein
VTPERRKTPRVSVRLPLTDAGGGSTIGHTRNLSENGLLLIREGETAVGQVLELNLRFPGVNESFRIECEVLRAKPTGLRKKHSSVAAAFRRVHHPAGRTIGDVLRYIALRGRNPIPVLDVSADWRPHLFSNDMRPHWRGIQADGKKLDLNGCNYFPLPAPLPDVQYSARFDPRSVYFLSWVGVYILPPIDGERVPKSVYAELGNRDNLGWLKNMGDPKPFSVTENPPLVCMERDENGNECRWSVMQDYVTHSDVGANNPIEGVPPIMRVEKDPWTGKYGSYQEIRQSPTYFELWYENDYLIVAFVSCTDVTDASGRVSRNDEDPAFHEATQAMLRSICIVDDGGGFRGPPPLRR